MCSRTVKVRRMNRWTTVLCGLLTVCFDVPLIRSQCPTLSSGFCFVDCTNATVYKIACENIRGYDLYSDLKVYDVSMQLIDLSLWSPVGMDRLTAAILRSVNNQLVRLLLDNMVNLVNFPELRSQIMLKELIIMNSPLLKDMPLELLPPQWVWYGLEATGGNIFRSVFLVRKTLVTQCRSAHLK